MRTTPLNTADTVANHVAWAIGTMEYQSIDRMDDAQRQCRTETLAHLYRLAALLGLPEA